MQEHARKPAKIPTAAKIGYSLWMIFWVPVVLSTYGPQNFFWLCNLAQFLLLWAVWREHRLLLSSQAGLVTVVGGVWTLDLVAALAAGGHSPTGITAYLFDDRLALIARLSSLYHVGLPVIAIWLCQRIGYDARGLPLQCVLASVVVLAGWLVTDAERNINYVHAPFGIEQTWLPESLYLIVLLAGNALLIFLPGHLLLRWIAAR